MHTHINGQTIILSPPRPTNAVRSLLSGRAWQVADSNGLDTSDCIDLGRLSQDLKTLKDKINSQFIDRAEMIDAMALALASGEHVFTYGPPGTAKTALIQAFTTGIGGNFAERQITAETTTDEVFGPIDAIAFSQGQYTRRWAGIATSDVFYINEVWEASSTVTNIFKTALESRIVHDGDVSRSIPLLSAVADSNHIPSEKGQMADWDRFMIRLVVGYIKDADLFGQMLTAGAGGVQIPQLLTPDELRLVAAAAELMALDPPADLKDALIDLWRELGQNGRSVSDRRWRKTLKLACANALLNNETPEPKHLAIARWTLWNELDEKDEVSNLVLSKCDPLISLVLNSEAILADIKKAVGDLVVGDSGGRLDMMKRCRQLDRDIDGIIGQSNGYKSRLQAVKNEVKEGGPLLSYLIDM